MPTGNTSSSSTSLGSLCRWSTALHCSNSAGCSSRCKCRGRRRAKANWTSWRAAGTGTARKECTLRGRDAKGYRGSSMDIKKNFVIIWWIVKEGMKIDDILVDLRQIWWDIHPPMPMTLCQRGPFAGFCHSATPHQCWENQKFRLRLQLRLRPLKFFCSGSSSGVSKMWAPALDFRPHKSRVFTKFLSQKIDRLHLFLEK